MANQYKLTYNYNRGFFNEIDTPQKAYFLGFILGDGHLNKKRNNVQIEISEIDIDILELFRKELGDCPSIKKRKNRSTVYLSLTSKELVNGLERQGIPSGKKSFNTKFPILVKQIEHHFIRGVFDSDGSFTTRKSTKKYPRGPNVTIEFAGSHYLINEIKNFFEGGSCGVITTNQKTHRYRKTFSDSLDMLYLYDFLYKDSENLCLSRKKEKLESIIKERIEWENLRRMRASKPEIVII